MSVSMYRSQVDRISAEIAKLRANLADEEAKAHNAQARAIRAAQSARRASSASQTTNMLREAERHQKAAVDHRTRAARIEGQIANKRRPLTAAQNNLERALDQERRTKDREVERRRREELAHLRRLELKRRDLFAWPEGLHARPIPVPRPRAIAPVFTEAFDVCLSFAGEQRGYVELVAHGLKEAGVTVFYDQDEDIRTRAWGLDLTEFLDYVYRQASRLCVMFVSRDYAEKEWTRLERRSALDRAMREGGEYILPARFDDTELPGLRPSIGYLELRELAPATLTSFILRKLNQPTLG